MLITGKKYIRRPIKNAADLDREQERIRMKYKRIEARMLFTIFGSAALSLAGKIRKPVGKRRLGSERSQKKRSFFGKLASFLKRPPFAFLVKSWLRWQLFNIVYFGIKRISRNR